MTIETTIKSIKQTRKFTDNLKLQKGVHILLCVGRTISLLEKVDHMGK